jgi:hypothetical protein
VPLATTVNVAVLPESIVTEAGWVEMLGATTGVFTVTVAAVEFTLLPTLLLTRTQ